MPPTPQKSCDKCGKPNRLQARFCGHCGQQFVPAGSALEGRAHQGKHRLPTSVPLLLAISAVVALLVYTNPSPDHYRAFVQRQLVEAATIPEERFVASLFTPLLGWGIDAFTERTNYYVFSVYATHLNTAGGLKAIGILGTFIVVERPQAFSPRPPAHARSV